MSGIVLEESGRNLVGRAFARAAQLFKGCLPSYPLEAVLRNHNTMSVPLSGSRGGVRRVYNELENASIVRTRQSYNFDTTMSETINGEGRKDYHLTCDYSSSFQLFSFTSFSRSSRYFPCKELRHRLN